MERSKYVRTCWRSIECRLRWVRSWWDFRGPARRRMTCSALMLSSHYAEKTCQSCPRSSCLFHRAPLPSIMKWYGRGVREKIQRISSAHSRGMIPLLNFNTHPRTQKESLLYFRKRKTKCNSKGENTENSMYANAIKTKYHPHTENSDTPRVLRNATTLSMIVTFTPTLSLSVVQKSLGWLFRHL